MTSEIDTFVSWLSAQQTGRHAGGFAGQPHEYGVGCCGPDSLLHRAVREAMRDGPGGGLTPLQEPSGGLRRLCETVGRRCGDRLLPCRLEAYLQTLTALAGGAPFRQAAEAFEAATAGGVQVHPLGFTPPAGDPVVRAFGTRLPLDRAGGWMVYDMLEHLNPPAAAKKPSADVRREEIPVLVVSDGAGAVRKFVVERLPGPPGLVTPDWWPMGLLRLPQTDGTHEIDFGFVESTQAVLAAVCRGPKGPAGRLRWRLEAYRPQEDVGATPISGRSCEAAVACCGLAVLEAAGPGGERVLNPALSATATVERGDADIHNCQLAPVYPGTLADKFRAAGDVGLGEVVIADGQSTKDLPGRPRPTPVATLGEAFEELQLTNQYVRNHQKRVSDEFDKKWHLEEAPE